LSYFSTCDFTRVLDDGSNGSGNVVESIRADLIRTILVKLLVCDGDCLTSRFRPNFCGDLGEVETIGNAVESV